MNRLIGISCAIDYTANDIRQRRSYALMVERAGGIPLYLPPLLKKSSLDRLFQRIDGLILSGGGDLNPHYFREEPQTALGGVEPERDAFEIHLAQAAWERRLPLLAICRGFQVINCALGGDIWQDLAARPGTIQHQQQAPPWHRSHQVKVDAPFASLVERASSEKIWTVNSLHHQGIRRLAPELRAAAHSSDDLVEAAWAGPKRFFCGVQWHPEWLGEQPGGLALFRAFLETK